MSPPLTTSHVCRLGAHPLFSKPIRAAAGTGMIVVAALNLVLDFDLIEKGASHGAPKFVEWYAAFGLMVTLIWLYIEFLRLLVKLRSR